LNKPKPAPPKEEKKDDSKMAEEKIDGKTEQKEEKTEANGVTDENAQPNPQMAEE